MMSVGRVATLLDCSVVLDYSKLILYLKHATLMLIFNVFGSTVTSTDQKFK